MSQCSIDLWQFPHLIGETHYIGVLTAISVTNISVILPKTVTKSNTFQASRK